VQSNQIHHNGSGALARRRVAGELVENTVLLRLPPAEFEALEPHLEFVELNLSENLQREGEPIRFVYFLNRGIASILVETSDGRSVEVGVAGREDMIGLQLAAGIEHPTHNLVVQVPGNGFRVPAMAMKNALNSLPELRRILTRQLGIRAMQYAQNAACNRLHNVKQRLARWLLLTRDRIDSDVIATTHDYLAKLVGTDRPTVSVALAELQREGTILGSRGAISVVNRSRLRQHACECYSLFCQFNAEMGLS
jgi:CRP-like cAMP-binding protein